MKVKTSELTGVALDWAVAKSEGFFIFALVSKQNGECMVVDEFSNPLMYHDDWTLGGEIIESEKIGVWFSEGIHDENGKVLREACWYAETSCTTDNGDMPYKCEIGKTPLIAAMRCYVASKLGAEVELPTELTMLGE